MGGTDAMDQTISNYDPCRRTKRWVLKYSIYLFRILLNNAYILYNFKNQKKIRKFGSTGSNDIFKNYILIFEI
jgi:hypothetical protein